MTRLRGAPVAWGWRWTGALLVTLAGLALLGRLTGRET